MAASPFAERLAGEARPILGALRRVLAPAEAFEAATTTRVFRVALPDLNDSLFPLLAARICKVAPASTLEWATRDERVLVHVLEGQIDLALVPSAMPLTDDIAFGDDVIFHWASFVRRRHPAIARWSRAAWTRWPHVAVRVDGRIPSPVEIAQHDLAQRRKVAVWVPHFSAVAPLVAKTNLVATLPVVVMADRVRRFGLAVLEPSIAIEPMAHRLIWSRRLDREPAMRWLRGHTQAALDEVIAAADRSRPRSAR